MHCKLLLYSSRLKLFLKSDEKSQNKFFIQWSRFWSSWGTYLEWLILAFGLTPLNFLLWMFLKCPRWHNSYAFLTGEKCYFQAQEILKVKVLVEDKYSRIMFFLNSLISNSPPYDSQPVLPENPTPPTLFFLISKPVSHSNLLITLEKSICLSW